MTENLIHLDNAANWSKKQDHLFQLLSVAEILSATRPAKKTWVTLLLPLLRNIHYISHNSDSCPKRVASNAFRRLLSFIPLLQGSGLASSFQLKCTFLEARSTWPSKPLFRGRADPIGEQVGLLD